MSPQAASEEIEKSSKTECNGRPNEPSDIQESSKKMSLQKKVYAHRNSVLTDLMEVNHLQTVYNISVAVFTLLLLNSSIYYIVAPKMFWRDIQKIYWGLSNPLLFVCMWLMFNAFAFSVFLGFKAWVRTRNKIHSKLADTLFLLFYITAIILMFAATAYTVLLQNAVRPITNFAIMCEQVRIFMKIYSFIKENIPRILQYKPSKDGKQESNIIPAFKHYVYFLFVPTLIYKDSYPQKKDISYRFIGQNLFKFFACIFITYCIFMRFVVDVFENTGIRPFNAPEAALTYVGATVVGSMMMFLMFYGLLHSWLNVFAELLRFGDREFYQDWWNSTSFSQYYRKWNLVVYDWLYTYVYMESNKMGLSRSVSMIFVFIVSAFVHEYIIALSIGFFYPVLMIIYSTIGIIVIFITKKRTGQFWNTFMWSMLFSGWGLIVCLYALEWFARINCPGTNDAFQDFFLPRSWNKSCHIIVYS